ncbi:MAG TPA: acetyl-CoA C-acyltransferase family protein [Nitrosomonas sp.]|nr:acetyl-CoA C-acyltransferase family protein [Nitrosomonas sp.]HQX14360.1 acetyl-CoA C-acyltransferase family protein [Nitrosomonas sp.]HRB33663.1 acetyl-CoA C-acyltransferase family protein [Nitrosomonas sp.]HRB46424.1 acetyl-CoA C-acyltransferase family protein [Nitrosomonas sp.]HRB78264.1 acetyl-CoA C-acyltransferase family protein [Nitrosomonas sp.]
MKDVVILSGVRTAIGEYGGSLKSIAPTDLAAKVVHEAVSRAQIDPSEIGHLVFGNVIHGEARDMYLARVAAINGGLLQHTSALTVNRLCGSGLQAIISAGQTILLGDTQAAVAGGVESMSRAGFLLPALRWGQRMSDSLAIDMMVGALTDPFDAIHMGITAENIAEKWHITREQQDEFAVESHQRTMHAIKKGYFKSQIIPIETIVNKEKTLFDTDEHPRANANLAQLAKLNAVFKKGGTVTAGNASGINDGAAALVLMESKVAEKRNLKPLARLVSYGHAGVDPKYMGIGPVPAVQHALKRAKLKLSDIDVIESNEAFAAQACAVMQELGLDRTKTNPNGGAVALGHPIGATGSILTIKAIYELHRCQNRYALVTMCIGGGQGIAAIFERLY